MRLKSGGVQKEIDAYSALKNHCAKKNLAQVWLPTHRWWVCCSRRGGRTPDKTTSVSSRSYAGKWWRHSTEGGRR